MMAKRCAVPPIPLDWEGSETAVTSGIWLGHRVVEVSPFRRLQSLALPLRVIGRQPELDSWHYRLRAIGRSAGEKRISWSEESSLPFAAADMHVLFER